MIESGYLGFKMLNWTGVMAPTGTSKRIIDRIAKEISRAVREPTIAARLTAGGVDLVGNSPEEFAAMIASDIRLWSEAANLAGIAPSER